MDFLKDIFGGEALTFEQLSDKIKGNDKIKIANLADGEYVSKHRLTEAENLLRDEKAKYADYDPEWKTKLQEAKDNGDKQLSEYKLQQALEKSLGDAKVKDTVSVKAHLDMDKIKLGDEDKLEGLSEQLESLKTDKAFLFEAEKTEPKLNLGGSTPGSTTELSGGLKSAIADHYAEQND